jgi:hypothetical protein
MDHDRLMLHFGENRGRRDRHERGGTKMTTSASSARSSSAIGSLRRGAQGRSAMLTGATPSTTGTVGSRNGQSGRRRLAGRRWHPGWAIVGQGVRRSAPASQPIECRRSMSSLRWNRRCFSDAGGISSHCRPKAWRTRRPSQ